MKKYIYLLFVTIIINDSCAQKNTKKTIENMNTTLSNTDSSSNLKTIILGGGCFWCTEAVYQDLKGIIKTESGYTGGMMKNPSYKDICTGTTGHAEVIKITYDPSIITLKDIIDIFWHVHDPTTINRQGNDAGTQYRSVIFYATEEEKQIAEKSKFEAQTQKIWSDPIVTTLEPLSVFYKAEDYHQNYFNTNPNQGYCVYVINPKVEKFRKEFKEKLK